MRAKRPAKKDYLRSRLRTCITCEIEKSLDEFAWVCGGVMGKGTKCKGCSKVYVESQKIKKERRFTNS